MTYIVVVVHPQQYNVCTVQNVYTAFVLLFAYAKYTPFHNNIVWQSYTEVMTLLVLWHGLGCLSWSGLFIVESV